MRLLRRRGWGIDLFLWLCPLVGMGAFVARLLAGRVPPPSAAFSDPRLFDVPGTAWLALLGGALLAPLIVSLLTGRLRGFLAGASLLLLIAAGAAWAGSHWAGAVVDLVRVTGPPQHATFGVTGFSSLDGGFDLRWVRGGAPAWQERIRVYFLAPGREQSLSFFEVSPGQGYPSLELAYLTTPQWLRRLGFAAAVHPRASEREFSIDFPFALALPYWFLCLLAVPFPLAWTLRLRRSRCIARRTASGLCKNCGYDLRATPDATGALLPICPECGAAARAATVADN